jgi:8-oxo-dGTP diphosphatase
VPASAQALPAAGFGRSSPVQNRTRPRIGRRTPETHAGSLPTPRRIPRTASPGGHIEPGETFAETAVREFKEETGLLVRALSSRPIVHPPDANATPEPVPFYVDVEREGFAVPAIAQVFYVQRQAGAAGQQVEAQLDEVHDAAWFTLTELDELPTPEQVRSLARYALRNYPIESERA